MQDECKKNWNNGNLGSCGKCQYMEVCCHYEAYAPAQLNLTDPPRFNEAQMAFWRGLYAVGIRRVHLTEDKTLLDMFDGKDAFAISRMAASSIKTGLEAGETLDLAELLGKDGA